MLFEKYGGDLPDELELTLMQLKNLVQLLRDNSRSVSSFAGRMFHMAANNASRATMNLPFVRRQMGFSAGSLFGSLTEGGQC